MTKTLDMTGVENFGVCMVQRARKDFIKGGKILYRKFNSIPEEKELIRMNSTLYNHPDVRWMYDAWRFVKNDPYSFFGDVGEESIIDSWTCDAILDYYRCNYISGAVILNELESKKKIQNIADTTIMKYIPDKTVAKDFIEARNYFFTIPEDGKQQLEELNSAAYERYLRKKKNGGKGRTPISQTEYAIKKSEEKAKKMKMAKDLADSGMARPDIAKALGVTLSCIHGYLRNYSK